MKFGIKKSPKANSPAPDSTCLEERPIDAFEAAWPFNADSPQVDGFLREDKFLSIMLVDVTGMDWETIAGHLETVREITKAKKMVPVFVVDLVEYRDLMTEKLAYDTLPNVAANGPLAQDLDWQSYLDWRRQLLKEKWRPAAIINLGLHGDWDAK